MNCPINPKFFTSTKTKPIIAILLLLLLAPSPASCFTSLRGTFFGEKARLGSRPPSCHNKCNQCHPCMAVQVPTMPTTHHPVKPVEKTRPGKPIMLFNRAHIVGNGYSNYKPLGWKCQCGDHFYNP